MATRKPAPRKRGATSSKKRSRSASPRRGLPGWVWGAAGIAAGFLLAHHQNGTAPWQDARSPVAAVLPKPSGAGQGNSASTGAAGQTGAGSSSGTPSEPPMPTFEFYTLLPESEVIAPDGDMPASTAKRPEAAQRPDTPAESADDPIAAVIAANTRDDERAAAPAAAPSDDKRYMLQAASFRELSDARQLAGRLKDFGLLAKISEVEATGGATWHRVQVGPYGDRRELSRAQDLMSTQGIEPLMIQLQN